MPGDPGRSAARAERARPTAAIRAMVTAKASHHASLRLRELGAWTGVVLANMPPFNRVEGTNT